MYATFGAGSSSFETQVHLCLSMGILLLVPLWFSVLVHVDYCLSKCLDFCHVVVFQY